MKTHTSDMLLCLVFILIPINWAIQYVYFKYKTKTWWQLLQFDKILWRFFFRWKLSSSAFPLFIEQGLQFEHYTKMSLIIWQGIYKLTKYLNILKEKSILHINLLASPSLWIKLHMKQDVISLIVSVNDKRETLSLRQTYYFPFAF